MTTPAPDTRGMDIAELRRLEKAATQAPWFTETNEKSAHVWLRGRISRSGDVRTKDNTGPIADIDCALEPDAPSFSPMDQEAVANAVLIAAARNALPALLDRLETDEARLAIAGRRIAELEEALGWFCGADDRFQVAVGGNPKVVDRMVAEAQARYAPSTPIRPPMDAGMT